MRGYKDYAMHFRGFAVGCTVTAVSSLLIGAISLLFG